MSFDSRSIHSLFPSTHWTSIAVVQSDDGEAKRAAIERILLRYRPALKAHAERLINKHHMSGLPAEEVLQGFISEKVLAGL